MMKYAKQILPLVLGVSLVALAAGCSSWGRGGADDGRTPGRVVDDRIITDKIEEALAKDPVYKLRNVEVTTFRGVVQLTGFVASEDQKQRALQVAQRVSGIRDIQNNIAVRPGPSDTAGGANQQQPNQSTGGSQDIEADVDADVDMDTDRQPLNPDRQGTNSFSQPQNQPADRL